MKTQRWSKEDEIFLTKNHETMTYVEMEKVLDRNSRTISAKAIRMNLRKIENKYIDIAIGERFNKLVAIKPGKIIRVAKTIRRYWFFRCDCEQIKELDIRSVKTQLVKSCGCLKSEPTRSNRIHCRKPPGETSFNFLFYACKAAANNRNNIDFNLTPEQHKQIILQACYYCGTLPSPFNVYLKKDGTFRRNAGHKDVMDDTIELAWIYINGVDRVNNDMGYFVENCVPCCFDCNEMKNNRIENDFISHVNKIASFQERKNKK